jgi:hypothetical protein
MSESRLGFAPQSRQLQNPSLVAVAIVAFASFDDGAQRLPWFDEKRILGLSKGSSISDGE